MSYKEKSYYLELRHSYSSLNTLKAEINLG